MKKVQITFGNIKKVLIFAPRLNDTELIRKVESESWKKSSNNRQDWNWPTEGTSQEGKPERGQRRYIESVARHKKSSLKILGKRKNKFRKRKEEENFEIRVIELDNI